MTNIIMGIIWVIFSILAYLQIGDMPELSALFPRVIIICIGIVGALLSVDSLIRIKRGTEESKSTLTKEVFIFQILIPGILLFTTYFLLTVFGFYISSFILVISVYLYQIYRSNETKFNTKYIVKGLGVSTIITGLMYVIFTMLLGLPVPAGSFFS